MFRKFMEFLKNKKPVKENKQQVTVTAKKEPSEKKAKQEITKENLFEIPNGLVKKTASDEKAKQIIEKKNISDRDPRESKFLQNELNEQINEVGKELIESAKKNDRHGIDRIRFQCGIYPPTRIKLNQEDLNKAFMCIIKNYNACKKENPLPFERFYDSIFDLLDMGADINYEEDNTTALLSAIYKNDCNFFVFLFSRHADLNHVTQAGEAALNTAIYREVDPFIMNTLLENKVNVNHINKEDGYTVLMLGLIVNSSPDIIEKILKLPGGEHNINAVNEDGDTALNILIRKLLDWHPYGIDSKACARKLQLLSLLLNHHAIIHDFERLYDFLRRIYVQSEKKFFNKHELLSLSNPRFKESFFNLLTCFQIVCSQLQQKKRTKDTFEEKGQSFEKEANLILLNLQEISNFLQKPSHRLTRSASSSQLNIFQEQNKQKKHLLSRSLSNEGLLRSSKRI